MGLPLKISNFLNNNVHSVLDNLHHSLRITRKFYFANDLILFGCILNTLWNFRNFFVDY
jgi:hypothetical protein